MPSVSILQLNGTKAKDMLARRNKVNFLMQVKNALK